MSAGRWSAFAAAATLLLAACSGGGAGSSSPATPSVHHRSGSGSTPIQHVVLMIQENRSFNNLFAGFPNATSATTGYELVKRGMQYRKKAIKLKEINLQDPRDLNHLYTSYLTAYNGGKMDGFNMIIQTANNRPEGSAPYVYVNPSQVQPYWTIASQWGLADEMFQTQGSASFTAHQDLIRGGTCITVVCNPPSANTESLIDDPTSQAAWGCDSKPGTATSTINTYLVLSRGTGPFPCSNQFPDYGSSSYRTLRDLLDAKSVSWKYYTPQLVDGTLPALWDAFDVIAPVRYGPEWGTKVVWPETTIFNDISAGTLPAMSWVIPDAANSDHPGKAPDTGPSWIAQVVNAIGQSQYWNSTAVIVVWDDWGGFYDPVPPPLPLDNQGGPGFRVPMLVVSPYVKIGNGSQGGYVSHTVYEFGSIIAFIEDTFNLGRLGTTDSTTNSMNDMFDLNQSPRPFATIPSSYKKAFFLHQKPSGLPVDTE